MKWIILFLTLPYFGVSQEIAFFETTIFFEDAAGNKDSVVVGHDENANNTYNEIFGEINIIEPWNSVFEVRGAHYLDWQNLDDELLLSKKIIGSNEGGMHPAHGCLLINEPIVFFANVRNLPIKISWDKSAFSSSFCRNRSTITPNVTPMVSEYWHEFLEQDEGYSCVAENNSIEFDKFDIDDGFEFYLVDEIEDNTVDTMVAMLLNFRFQNAFDSPCTIVVDTKDISVLESDIKIFPNPSEAILNIRSNDFSSWIILNNEAKLIAKGNHKSINIENLKCGLHYLSLLNDDGSLLLTKKFIKI